MSKQVKFKHKGDALDALYAARDIVDKEMKETASGEAYSALKRAWDSIFDLIMETEHEATAERIEVKLVGTGYYCHVDGVMLLNPKNEFGPCFASFNEAWDAGLEAIKGK